jgi:hypothetical protein
MARKTDNAPAVLRWLQNYTFGFSIIYTAVFFILTAAYILETFLPKPDKTVLTHYHLNHAGYYELVIPLVVILVIIWLISLYGSLRVKSYARLINNSKDGKGVNLISNGLLVQTITLPLISNISYVLGHIAKDHTRLQPTMTIIINYIALGLMGLAFIFIFWGSHKLFKLIPVRAKQLPYSLWQAVFITASSLYAYFVIIQPIHHPLDRKVYFLPDWLLVLTISVPYMFFWYLGIRGAYNIFLYRRNIKGSLYKSSMSYLAAGIAVVVLGSVATRIITSLSSRITNLKLTPILIIIYGFLALTAIGYILIAIGAKKLRNIEEA